MFWWASDRRSGASDSTVLRRFAVSVGRALLRASSAELRQFVVLIALRRAGSAELRQYLVIIAFLRWVVAEECPLSVALIVLTLVFFLSVNLFIFMDSLFINSGRCA